MNYSIIIYILGWILKFQAVFMALPLITSLIYQETDAVSFVITIVLCLLAGIPMTLRRPKNQVFHTKEGFVTVALSWIVLSITGALPFLFSGSITHPIDAIFETVSGFTTTGASILSDVEALSHGTFHREDSLWNLFCSHPFGNCFSSVGRYASV